MNNKQLKRLKRQLKTKNSYITKLQNYAKEYAGIPTITFLINNILESDRLIAKNLLPQDLPILELPDNIDQLISNFLQNNYPDNPDKWHQLVDDLPKLDHLLTSYREYLTDTYGLWAYISRGFVKDLSKYLNHRPTLEIMAGNGYISRGLRDLGQDVIATDSLEWVSEGNTGRKLITNVEKLDAIAAIEKYGSQVDFIIMSWAPDGIDLDQQVLSKMRAVNPQAILIMIGEPATAEYPGATNSAGFWKMANFVDTVATKQLNQHHQPFDLIHDQVYLIN